MRIENNLMQVSEMSKNRTLLYNGCNPHMERPSFHSGTIKRERLESSGAPDSGHPRGPEDTRIGAGPGDAPDIGHPALSVEVKARTGFPTWLEDALKQAELSAKDGKTPAVVLHPDRRPYRDALVVLRLSEFAALVGSRSGTPGR